MDLDHLLVLKNQPHTNSALSKPGLGALFSYKIAEVHIGSEDKSSYLEFLEKQAPIMKPGKKFLALQFPDDVTPQQASKILREP